jgi:aminoglycoside phosphotransferase (APT) family kinase protein
VLDIAHVRLGEAIIATERCAWGFTHQTYLLTTPKRRVILQLINPASTLATVADRARRVPAILALADLRAPALLVEALEHTPPFVMREYLPGRAASQLLGEAAAALALVERMGAVLARLRGIDCAAVQLPDLWANPGQLAVAGDGWLGAAGPLLAGATRRALADALRLLAAWPKMRPVVAHGDFCPVNVLVDAAGAIAGLIDFDEACLASPWFDAAWWGWVVRYHHPELWQRTWPAFLRSAGLGQDQGDAALVRATQLARLAELSARALAAGDHAAAQHWARRLDQTAAWE